MVSWWKTAVVGALLFGACVTTKGANFPFTSVQELESLVIMSQMVPCPTQDGKNKWVHIAVIDKEPTKDTGSFYVLWSHLNPEGGQGRFLLLQYDKTTGSPMGQVWEGIYLVEADAEIRLHEFPTGQKYDPVKHEDPCQALGAGSLTINL